MKLNEKIFQFCSFIRNLFQSYKMTFFRWMKYIYIFGYNVYRFTLLPAKRDLKTKKKKIAKKKDFFYRVNILIY